MPQKTWIHIHRLLFVQKLQCLHSPKHSIWNEIDFWCFLWHNDNLPCLSDPDIACNEVEVPCCLHCKQWSRSAGMVILAEREHCLPQRNLGFLWQVLLISSCIPHGLVYQLTIYFCHYTRSLVVLHGWIHWVSQFNCTVVLRILTLYNFQ
jgi:hypothetical protein